MWRRLPWSPWGPKAQSRGTKKSSAMKMEKVMVKTMSSAIWTKNVSWHSSIKDAEPAVVIAPAKTVWPILRMAYLVRSSRVARFSWMRPWSYMCPKWIV